MATIRNILVPLDLEGHSGRVLDVARTIGGALDASLHLLHVVTYPMADDEARRVHYEDALCRLKDMSGGANDRACAVTAECVFGSPAPEIARYAVDHDVDLIVMGTHSHGPAFQMLTGSIAEAVTGLVPCAVLTVKSEVSHEQAGIFDPIASVVARA